MKEHPAIDGATPAVRTDSSICQHDMVMELRFEGPGGRVQVVRGGDRRCREALTADANRDRMAAEIAKAGGGGLVQCVEDRRARRLVAGGPEHADGFRDREREVVAGNDARWLALCAQLLDERA